MRIASYNLLKGGTRRVHWTRLTERHGADLLLLQESYAPHEHLAPATRPDALSRAAWRPAGTNRWGSAVYSCSGTVAPLAVRGFGGWAVGAEIHAAPWQAWLSDPLLVFSVHVPAGPGGYWKQAHHLLDSIARIACGRPLVIGGDFNILISPRPDSARPAQRRDLEVQRRLADEFGLLNCWQSAHPGRAPCQTLRWTGDRTIPYHCDGIFVPAAWRDRLETCEVLSGGEWDDLSDHNPVVAQFTEGKQSQAGSRSVSLPRVRESSLMG